MVEMEGVEPSSSLCKSGVLPLNYVPEKVVERGGIEPPSPELQTGAKTTSATAPWGEYRESNPGLEIHILPLCR